MTMYLYKIFLSPVTIYIYVYKVLISPPPNSRYPPRVRFFVFIVQWFQSLILLVLAKFRRVSHLEEGGSEFYQPFRIYSRNFPHVFFSSLYKFVINNPKRKGGGELEFM